jgi:hypothetical protein
MGVFVFLLVYHHNDSAMRFLDLRAGSTEQAIAGTSNKIAPSLMIKTWCSGRLENWNVRNIVTGAASGFDSVLT